MSTSTNAMLMYGYNLGSEEQGWEIQELDQYGGIDYSRVEWLAHDEEAEELDFREMIDERLLASVGFTETDWKVDGYYDRQRAARARLGVTLEDHCSGDYPMWVLSACTITARRGWVETVSFADLAQRVVDEAMGDKLAAAIKALGMTPKQERPAWLLCSYWG
jgi:hypothetical protein